METNHNQLIDKIPDVKVLYCILTGLSYREIGIRFYSYNTNKFIYKVRTLMKVLGLRNRRQLAYFALSNNLVTAEKLSRYIEC